ncbi:hypothetical protein [Nocardia sp. XZ_19_385]|uniref:hypothetical protein n=1 Tax=Nocardia sp. XZ_19_385 TaxID=2769488 RepID=UPI001890B135|nr:hypothetical protein [Nocardia sp. XZ_19_385]
MSADGIDGQLEQWQSYLRKHGSQADADGLDGQLRGSIEELTATGLRPEESFLIALKRLAAQDGPAREFARTQSTRLWRDLVLTDQPNRTGNRPALLTMLVCAVGAAVAIKAPALFGADFDDSAEFYLRNLALFTLTPLAVYFGLRRRLGPAAIAIVAGLFVLGAVAANAYGLDSDSQSIALSAIHLPLALWLATGVAYAGGEWRSAPKRMDFIRFTGEWIIYLVLIYLGGGVLTAITAGTFDAIGIDVETFVGEWLVPCGAVAAMVVAAWLVETKQGVLETIAPMLTKIFTPLFTVVLLALLIGFGLSRTGLEVDRDVLILFDLLLAVILGLLLYAISATDRPDEPKLFDKLQLALVVSALLVDLLVLTAITGRITEYGTTPNKIAALGENLILLANLAWSAWLLFGFLRGRTPFARLERWQTSYLLVYAAWAWIVVLVFPPLFGFR